MNKFLLAFPDDTTMLAALGTLPASPYGTAIVRGEMGTPGKYEDTGQRDAGGEILWREVKGPVIWPGCHVELLANGDLPTELAMYQSPHDTWPAKADVPAAPETE